MKPLSPAWLLVCALLTAGAGYVGLGVNKVGDYTATFTFTGDTSVTFPTSGTMLSNASTLAQGIGGTGTTCGAGCLGAGTVNMAITTDQAITVQLGSYSTYNIGYGASATGNLAVTLYGCTLSANNTGATIGLYRGAGKTLASTSVTTTANLTGASGDAQRIPTTTISSTYTQTTLYLALTVAGTGTCKYVIHGTPLP